MHATLIHGPRDIRFERVDDPAIQRPTDAVVRVVASCVCGSDLWPYRGVQQTDEPSRIGHEFVGMVEAVGDAVQTVRVGDFVIAPFAISDGTCVHCRNGITTSCDNGEWWGSEDDDGYVVDGGQGEIVRVPLADGTLVATPDVPDDAMIPDLLTL
ncbi:MAG: alcohol dehydrogenase catalytic domain-containing protein, partial [Sporichthyaceae bacterium]|nr:alcohol dehydrogenase catalytic domain-containing protein [Sporichthyaceae bacterium]